MGKRSVAIKNFNMRRHYILTRPTRPSDLEVDEIEYNEGDRGWREKASRLQLRRWRKIKHQLA